MGLEGGVSCKSRIKAIVDAGLAMDGQLLIIADLLGEFQAFTPKFVTKKMNLAETATKALKEYHADVKSKAFPLDTHCYHCKKEEMPKIEALFKEMAKKPDKVTPLPKDGP